jgi:type II restriction enzyme
MGVTPIMDWASKHYGKKYAPNTRETFRRQTLHQFVEAGLVAYNPDQPDRPVNSPKAVYQLTPEALRLVRSYVSREWETALTAFLTNAPGLATRYAAHRELELVPLTIADGKTINLSPGAHSRLIRDIVEEFAPRFTPGATLIYVGDTGDKAGYFNTDLLAELGVTVDRHGKLPDVVLYDTSRNWLILAESVTSHGPVDGKRHGELKELFAEANPGLVFVSAFPDRPTMARYLSVLAWETEVWIADAPSHMVHLNGERFLGPY